MSDFWQRRKALVQKEQLAEQQAVEAQLARQEEARLAEKTDEELLADAGLPEPEVLDTPEGVVAAKPDFRAAGWAGGLWRRFHR